MYHVAMWCTAAEGGVSDSLCDFWESQSMFVSQGHLSTSTPLISVECIDAACHRLALCRPLFSKLGNHFDALVPLMKDCRYFSASHCESSLLIVGTLLLTINILF